MKYLYTSGVKFETQHEHPHQSRSRIKKITISIELYTLEITWTYNDNIS